ncbi:MAG: sensor domain-containing diguanylate cyclase [Oscillospiraceae bacterium]
MLSSSGAATSTDGCELVIQNSTIQIDYLSAAQVLKMCSEAEDSHNQKVYAEQLLAGKEVITVLGEQPFTTDPSSFVLLQPVFDSDGLSGTLRARIDVDLLIGGSVDSTSLFQKTYTVLTKADGSIVYANTPYPNEANLFSSALQGGIGSAEVQFIQQAFGKNEAKTIRFSGKGNNYYMSWESLSFHDWRIVRFARSPDVILQTKMILRGMVFAGVCLIILTAFFCVILIKLLLRQKRRLETQQRRYDALAQFNDTLLFEYDVLANKVVFTPNALERLDLDAKCLDGGSGKYYMQYLLHPEDLENIHTTIQPSQLRLGETYYLEVRLRCRGGEYSWFGCQFKSIEARDKVPSQIIGKLVDISDQRGREQTLRQAALADALTGVYNRGVEALINKQLDKDPRGLFFMIDLDNFKNVNDSYGHAAGDALLINVAQILREVFRPNDMIARVGGDEFAVFIAGTNDPAVAKNKAAAIQSRIERLYIPGSEQLISASIGAATSPQNGSTYDALTRAADQAMYSIKRKSKKGFALHHE